MKTWIVRKNCEYSYAVEAETWDEAAILSDSKPLEEWDTSWSKTEVDETEDEGV